MPRSVLADCYNGPVVEVGAPMTLLLNVPKDVQEDLTAEASRRGISIEEYALGVLASAVHPSLPKTGAELVEYWRKEGLIGTRTDITDSQEHARLLRQHAERQNQGQ